jgi:hypothetical protein
MIMTHTAALALAPAVALGLHEISDPRFQRKRSRNQKQLMPEIDGTTHGTDLIIEFYHV